MKKLLTLFLCLHVFAHGASPLYHALIGEKWLEAFENYNEQEKHSFMLGTLFPDIRYIAHIPRAQTHEHGLSIEEIRQTPDPFIKGMRVHAYVDEARVAFVESHPIVKALADYPGDQILFLKMLEDEILYSLCKKDPSYFETIDQGEIDSNIPLEVIQEWHKIQRIYFATRPSELFAKLASKQQTFSGFSPQTIQLLSHYLPLYSHKLEFQQFVLSSLAEFDRHFQATPNADQELVFSQH